MKSHLLCQWPRDRLRRLEEEQEATVEGLGLRGFDYVKDFEDGSGAAVVVLGKEARVVSRGVSLRAVGDPVNRRVGRVIARGRAIRAFLRGRSSSIVCPLVDGKSRVFPSDAARWYGETFGFEKSWCGIGKLTGEEEGI